MLEENKRPENGWTSRLSHNCRNFDQVSLYSLNSESLTVFLLALRFFPFEKYQSMRSQSHLAGREKYEKAKINYSLFFLACNGDRRIAFLEKLDHRS